MHYVYLVRCADDSIYCGWTTDLKKRVRAHNSGQGAKYTRSRRPVKLVYAEEVEEKQEALGREWHLKRLNRAEKIRLIENAGRKRNEDGS